MKKLIAAFVFTLITHGVYAACPVNLDGNYILSARKTTMFGGLDNVTYVVAIANITGSSLKYIKMFKAESNNGQPATEVTHDEVPVYYDNSTCTGYLEDTSNPHYFVVSDSGKVIKGLSGTEPGSLYPVASELELIKQ
jgi:hypothetical protein